MRKLGLGLFVVIVALVGLYVFLAQKPRGESVVYARHGGQTLRLFLFRPKGTGATTPAILLIHGGGFVQGDPSEMADLAQRFAGEGYLAAAVQYRFAPKDRWPAQLDDVQTAVRYLRAHAGELRIDPNRIGALGCSAGGQLANFLGVRDTRDPHPAEYPGLSSQVQAVWSCYSPIDFTKNFGDGSKAIPGVLFESPTPKNIREISPVFYVSKASAPTFFFHGKSDPLVSWEQSVEMATALNTHGVESEIHLVNNTGHEINQSLPEVQQALNQGVQWVNRHLKK